FAIPAEGIKEIKVLLTAIGGKVVYAAPEFGSVDRGLFKSAEYYGKAALK
ncbi:MAG: hypothetical protein HY644_00390, partial [Acidobacteria bacterium]|nr:hypothetical protein [Acidobacteriota bacterium]